MKLHLMSFDSKGTSSRVTTSVAAASSSYRSEK